MVEAVRLLRARSDNLTLMQGPKLLAEAVAAGIHVVRVFYLHDQSEPAVPGDADLVPVTEQVLERVTPTGDSWGPVAVIRIPEAIPSEGRPRLVLVDLADPGNVGTMIRSAAAFGYDVVSVGGVDPWSPKVLRAGAGGHFKTAVEQRSSIPSDRQVVASVVDGGTDLGGLELDEGHALVIGSEAHGLSNEIVAQADVLVTIPMVAMESLNAAAAASILMFELGRNTASRRLGRD